MVKVLWSHADTDFHAEDKESITPFMLAVENNQMRVVQWLLTSRLRQLPNTQGITPLHVAVGQASVDMVKLLIRAGAKAHIDFECSFQDKELIQLSPLLSAAGYAKEDIVNFLLDEYVM